MELRHLRYFIAVAEELHFGNAAKRLNISQPPLSQQIKQLEEQLQVNLFNRTNKKVELTEAGKLLYDHAVRLLREVEATIEDVQSVAKGLKGELKLGFSGSVAFEILPLLLQASRTYFPEITIELAQLTTSEQVKALEYREIDIGILVPPIDNPVIETEPFRIEEFVVCLPETHPLTQQKVIDIQDLQHESFIMAPKHSGVGYYHSIFAIFEDAGFTPHISQTANEQLTMVSLVASGFGVAIVPQSTQAIQIKGVTYRKLAKSYLNKNSIAWNKHNSRPILLEFLNFIRKEIIPVFSENNRYLVQQTYK